MNSIENRYVMVLEVMQRENVQTFSHFKTRIFLDRSNASYKKYQNIRSFVTQTKPDFFSTRKSRPKEIGKKFLFIFIFALFLTLTEALNLLQEVYGDDTMSRTIYWSGTGGLKREERRCKMITEVGGHPKQKR